MHTETVLKVIHHTDSLFSFTTTRSSSFRFRSGEFAMIGLATAEDKRNIFRAYSVCSTPYDNFLEFYSIIFPGGEFTSVLKNIKAGSEILIKPKTTGSLVVDYMKPKQNLVMLATGTGIAPFASIARDYQTYERFENLYLYHTVRESRDLKFGHMLCATKVPNGDGMCYGEMFTYIPTTTHEQHPDYYHGRFWGHIPKGPLAPDLDKDRDGVMVCGSPELNRYCRDRFTSQGWKEGNIGDSDADFMLERAFAG